MDINKMCYVWNDFLCNKEKRFIKYAEDSEDYKFVDTDDLGWRYAIAVD